jgi:signal transduction histidine kinase
MSPASVLSIATALVSALVGMVTIAVVRGARQTSLRWFAAASMLAAMFGAGNAIVGTRASAGAIVLAARFTLSVAGLHGAAWVAYDLDNSSKPASNLERGGILGALTFALLAWVPGLLVTDEVIDREAWFGLVYRDAVPTSLGAFAYVYYCVAIATLALRYARQVANGNRRSLPQLIGLGTLTLGAVLDSLAASQVTRMPYVLDFALMVVVLCVGAALASRFIETTRALDESATQLAAAQRELVARERLAAVGEMSAVVAHEVRNPLAVMFNAITGLRRTIASAKADQAHQLLDILQEEADRLRRLVDDFLDFARPLALRPTRTDARTLVQSAVDMARAAAPSPHRLRCSMTDDLGEIRCDVQLVRHALANLVENALQVDGTAIDIDVRASADAAALSVAVVDHGPGVTAEAEARIFLPFFTTRAQGTGLGLTIVKRVVEAHSGSVVVEATPGGGATFRVTLPRGAALQSVAPPDSG